MYLHSDFLTSKEISDYLRLNQRKSARNFIIFLADHRGFEAQIFAEILSAFLRFLLNLGYC